MSKHNTKLVTQFADPNEKIPLEPVNYITVRDWYRQEVIRLRAKGDSVSIVTNKKGEIAVSR